eukprot:m.135566 g.135566  ORF g.135566 m.135566 type:complete len:376 (+) comp15850_c0_seq1:211-1338(+)
MIIAAQRRFCQHLPLRLPFLLPKANLSAAHPTHQLVSHRGVCSTYETCRWPTHRHHQLKRQLLIDSGRSSWSISTPAVFKTNATMTGSKVVDIKTDITPDVIQSAVTILKKGGVISVPTDTIYGLACLAQSTEGVRRIYAIKGREETKPIAICMNSVAEIEAYAESTVSQKLLSSLLPGPVTVILPRKPALNPELNPHTHLIGIRVPDFPFVRQLVAELGEPLALTSANRSGEQSCIQCHEFEHLFDELDAVYDAGMIEASGASRLGSTVVDLSRGTQYLVVRAGSAEQQTLATLHAHGLVPLPQEQEKLVPKEQQQVEETESPTKKAKTEVDDASQPQIEEQEQSKPQQQVNEQKAEQVEESEPENTSHQSPST